MKVYKIEVMVIDLDDIGETEIVDVIENTKYPNHCISPTVKAIESRDIGQWHEDHPLNKADTEATEYQRLFSIAACQEGGVR